MTDRKHPHPMPGCLAVYPLRTEKEPTSDDEGIRPLVTDEIRGVTVYQVDLAKLFNVEQGIAVAQVVEVGPHDDPRIGVEVGSVVYYPESRGVEIGEYIMLNLSNVLAYEDPLDYTTEP